nr:uncharacterized protein CI109_006568 [Kwoniella shandongensis]KAA5525106.1 hypothetical protein CI109_006568 [Kwoniella shandongensis]
MPLPEYENVQKNRASFTDRLPEENKKFQKLEVEGHLEKVVTAVLDASAWKRRHESTAQSSAPAAFSSSTASLSGGTDHYTSQQGYYSQSHGYSRDALPLPGPLAYPGYSSQAPSTYSNVQYSASAPSWSSAPPESWYYSSGTGTGHNTTSDSKRLPAPHGYYINEQGHPVKGEPSHQ